MNGLATTRTKYRFGVDGHEVTVDSDLIPKLFIAWVAANRASYYAKLDSERGDGEHSQVFAEEFNYAIRHEEEWKDWLENNMDLPEIKRNEIQVEELRVLDDPEATL